MPRGLDADSKNNGDLPIGFAPRYQSQAVLFASAKVRSCWAQRFADERACRLKGMEPDKLGTKQPIPRERFVDVHRERARAGGFTRNIDRYGKAIAQTECAARRQAVDLPGIDPGQAFEFLPGKTRGRIAAGHVDWILNGTGFRLEPRYPRSGIIVEPDQRRSRTPHSRVMHEGKISKAEVMTSRFEKRVQFVQRSTGIRRDGEAVDEPFHRSLQIEEICRMPECLFRYFINLKS